MTVAATNTQLRPAPVVSDLRALDPSDQELVERAQQGDPWAEQALFRRHVGRVTQVARRLLGRTADAEDAVQDSFVIALEQLPKLRDGSAFRSWLMRIVVHQAHRRYRRKRMLNRLGFVAHEDLDTLSCEAREGLSVELRTELKKLDVVLRSLDAKQRIAWVLRNVEGCQLEDVADACDCSLATVKRWIAKADEQIRKHVRIEGPRDE